MKFQFLFFCGLLGAFAGLLFASDNATLIQVMAIIGMAISIDPAVQAWKQLILEPHDA